MNKGKIFLTMTFAFVVTLLCTTTAFADDAYTYTKDDSGKRFWSTISVMDFGVFKHDNGEVQTEERASWLSQYLRNALWDSSFFELVDLKLTKYDLGKGTASHTEAISLDAAKKIGKELDVDYVVYRIFDDKKYVPMFEIVSEDDAYVIKTSIHVGVVNLKTNENERTFTYEGNFRIDKSEMITTYGKNSERYSEDATLTTTTGTVTDSDYSATDDDAYFSKELTEKICDDLINDISEEILSSLLWIGLNEHYRAVIDEKEDENIYTDVYRPTAE